MSSSSPLTSIEQYGVAVRMSRIQQAANSSAFDFVLALNSMFCYCDQIVRSKSGWCKTSMFEHVWLQFKHENGTIVNFASLSQATLRQYAKVGECLERFVIHSESFEYVKFKSFSLSSLITMSRSIQRQSLTTSSGIKLEIKV